MLTIKQKMMLESFKVLFNKIHKKDTVLTEQYCKQLVKTCVDEIYRLNPDRKTGKIAISWFDEKMNKPSKIYDGIYCFEINFYDVITGLPWLICRFYNKIAKVGIYCW